MPKPALVLVPGSFSFPKFYETITKPLADEGWEIKALHLPSVGPGSGQAGQGPAPSMYDDAAFIGKAVEALADEGKDVVLFAHSYGGVPATQSTKGLSKSDRAKEGKQGGLDRLAYLTCLVPAIGEAATTVLAGAPPENVIPMEMDENGWLIHTDIAQSARVAFSDDNQEDGEAWVRKFARHSAQSFADPLTHAGYLDVPVSYLRCTKDLCIPRETQEKGIEMIETLTGNKVDMTDLEMGHCPMTKNPQAVIDWMVKVASTDA